MLFFVITELVKIPVWLDIIVTPILAGFSIWLIGNVVLTFWGKEFNLNILEVIGIMYVPVSILTVTLPATPSHMPTYVAAMLIKTIILAVWLNIIANWWSRYEDKTGSRSMRPVHIVCIAVAFPFVQIVLEVFALVNGALVLSLVGYVD